MEKISYHKRSILIFMLSFLVASALWVLLYPLVPLISFYLPFSSQENIMPRATISYTPLISWDEYVASGRFPQTHIVITRDVLASEERSGNYIVIPKIGVDMEIAQGTDQNSALSQGAWLIPQTSTPGGGGNTVLTAHRFRYLPPYRETFYLLDKLVEGDTFQVFWGGKEYRYVVNSSSVVAADAFEVLDQTDTSTVTLLTCNPLFSTKERLVVNADLVEVF